jgi:FtsP/CotA-like multicopper oxidase with cupredoxin domain
VTAALLTFDLLGTLLVAVAWVGLAVSVAVGRARVALVVLGAAVLVTAGRVALVGALAGSGWWFVQEKVLLALPLIVVPGIAAVVWAGPALASGQRPGRIGTGAVLAAAGGGLAGVLATLVVGYPATPRAGLLLALLVVVPALVPAPRLVRVVAVGAAAVLAAGMLGGAWAGSRLPDRLGHTDHHGAHGPTVSVADLRGPRPAPGEEARRFRLTARQADVVLPSGRAVHAWTFDGQLPGPELTVTQGELVEVELRNADIEAGVTIHWHGYPVPAGEDGVAGVTQDAVRPGDTFTYWFRATQAGTYWYHAHQVSEQAVPLGLYGVLVVRPAAPQVGLDVAVALHTQSGTLLTGAVDGVGRRAVTPGTPVRLRLVNTDDGPHAAGLRGTPFRLGAVDGHELAGGAPLDTQTLVPLPAGGRADLLFTMPAEPVQLAVDARRDAGLLFSPDGTGEPLAPVTGRLLDVTQYAPAGPSPLGARFDQNVTLVLDRTLGFLDGVPASTYTVNGRVYPDVPPITVREGDLVRITVVNRGIEPHPMHPHGHSVLVLARDGVPASGPLWTDSFDVGPGEVWTVALRADNPGIWMSHCHNLEHARAGMVLHLAYTGVETPFAVGPATGNYPE